MTNKITCITHSADFDGLFCQAIAKKFLPTETTFIGWDFKDAPLQIPDGKIYILDLPVDRVFGFTYKPEDVTGKPPQHPAGLVWIDHHKSSIETHPTDIPGYRIDGVAACRLAWQWFLVEYGKPGPDFVTPTKQDFIDRKVSEPLAVRLAGEYDIWDHQPSNNEDIVFQFGLRQKPLTDHDWQRLLAENDEEFLNYILQLGRPLYDYQKGVDIGVMHRSFMMEWEGLKFLALNTARCNSLTFASKDKPETGHDALLGFYFDGKFWHVSLYHAEHRKDIDLSVIATNNGGGGHKGACGFKTPSILSLNWKML